MSSTDLVINKEQETLAKAGKYLIFHLNEEYGVEILKVQEIIGMQSVTTVPNMPEFIKGIINLRGRIIPVVDLRLKFKMEEKQYTERTCIIIIQVVKEGKEKTLGIIVDEVSEVEDIEQSNIEPTPSFGSNIANEYILGIGKSGDRVVMLLNIDKVFSDQEIKTITQDQ